MEKYCCSLELAKKLKELGVKQESEFYWFKPNFGGGFELITKEVKNKISYSEVYSAFIVGELGEIVLKPSNIEWKVFWNKNRCMIYPAGTLGFTMELSTFVADTEVNARAKMWIYLIESELI